MDTGERDKGEVTHIDTGERDKGKLKAGKNGCERKKG